MSQSFKYVLFFFSIIFFSGCSEKNASDREEDISSVIGSSDSKGRLIIPQKFARKDNIEKGISDEEFKHLLKSLKSDNVDSRRIAALEIRRAKDPQQISKACEIIVSLVIDKGENSWIRGVSSITLFNICSEEQRIVAQEFLISELAQYKTLDSEYLRFLIGESSMLDIHAPDLEKVYLNISRSNLDSSVTTLAALALQKSQSSVEAGTESNSNR